VYAVALHGAGEAPRAIAVLEAAHGRRPADRGVLLALVSYLQERGDMPGALRYAERLAALSPGDRQVQGLLQSLRGGAGAGGGSPRR
jgi:Flp pilus assembly protein TadD